MVKIKRKNLKNTDTYIKYRILLIEKDILDKRPIKKDIENFQAVIKKIFIFIVLTNNMELKVLKLL